MKFKIKNDGFRTKAFKVYGGTEDVRPGEEKTIDVTADVTDEYLAAMAKDGVSMKPLKDAKASSEAVASTPEGSAPSETSGEGSAPSEAASGASDPAPAADAAAAQNAAPTEAPAKPKRSRSKKAGN